MTRTAPAPGKRARTRATILDAALRLFARSGFDATTVAQIASAAGVSEMTFFRHFPSKESLLLDDPYDPLMADAVARQPDSLPLLRRVAAGIGAAWREIPPPEASQVRARLRIAAGSPALRGAMLRNTDASAAAIATALAERGSDPMEARIAATAALAAVTEALLAWAPGGDPDPGTAIERALRILAGER